MRIIGLLVALLLACPSARANEERVAALIARLGARAFEARKRAAARLLAGWARWTPADLAALEQATRHADPEVARQARRLGSRIRLRRQLGATLLKAQPELELALAAGPSPALNRALEAAAVAHLDGRLPASALTGLARVIADPSRGSVTGSLLRAVERWRLRSLYASAVGLARHGDPEVRSQVVALLRRLDGPAATAALRSMLADADDGLRLEAAVALARRDDGASRDRILALKPPHVRKRLAYAIGRDPGRGLAILKTLLADDDPQVREAAAGSLGWHQAPHISAARSARLAIETHVGVLAALLWKLAGDGGTDEEIDAVLPFLEAADGRVRRMAAIVLERHGGFRHAPAVARQLASRTGREAEPLHEALARIGGPPELRAMTALLPKAAPATAVSATRSLLGRALTDRDAARLAMLLAHPRAEVREAAWKALTWVRVVHLEPEGDALSLVDPEMFDLRPRARRVPLPLTVAGLTDASAEVRLRAASLLADQGRREAAPRLLPLLRDADRRVRLIAAEALVRLRARATLPAVRALAADPVAGWAVRVVRHGLGERIALAPLLRAVTTDPPRRSLAKVLLAHTPRSEAAKLLEAVLAALKGANRSSRQRLLQPLDGDLVADLPLEALAPLLAHPEEVVRAHGLKLLMDRPGDAAAARLIAGLADASAVVRRAALGLLYYRATRVGRVAPRHVNAIVALLDDADNGVRSGAISALGAQAPGRLVAEAPRLLRDPAVRRSVIWSLSDPGQREAIERLLLPLLENPQEPQRGTVLRMLTRIGSRAHLSHLQRQAQSESESERSTACSALADLGCGEHFWQVNADLLEQFSGASSRLKRGLVGLRSPPWPVSQARWLMAHHLREDGPGAAGYAWLPIAFYGRALAADLVALLGHPSTSARVAASRALAHAGVPVGDRLVGLLGAHTRSVRQRALIDLGSLGAVEQAGRVAPFTRSPNWSTRTRALVALGRMAAGDQLDALTAGLADPDRYMRRPAARAIAALPPGPEVRAVLRRLTDDDDADVRAAAGRGLARDTDNAARAALHNALLREHDPATHGTLCAALGQHGEAFDLRMLAAQLEARGPAWQAPLLRAATQILARETSPEAVEAWRVRFGIAIREGWPATRRAGRLGRALLEADPASRIRRLRAQRVRPLWGPSAADVVLRHLEPEVHRVLHVRRAPKRDVRSLADLAGWMAELKLTCAASPDQAFVGRVPAGQPTTLAIVIADHVRQTLWHRLDDAEARDTPTVAVYAEGNRVELVETRLAADRWAPRLRR